MVSLLPLLLAFLLSAPAGAQQAGPEPTPEALAAQVPAPPPPAGEEDFQVAFVLYAGNEVAFERVEVELDLPGGAQTIPLVDDGTLPEDMAWDGIYVGIWRGPFLRWAQVRLLAGAQDAPAVLSEGLERFYDQRGVQVAWRLVPADRRVAAVRTAATPLAGTDDVQGRVELLASFGWAALLAVFLGTLAVRAREARP